MNQKRIDFEKYLDRPLTKFMNSKTIKDIYPMIDKIEVHNIDFLGLILKIFVDDEEMEPSNMYEKGLDPYYLIDYHMAKVLPYFSIPPSTRKGFVIIGPNMNVIHSSLPR